VYAPDSDAVRKMYIPQHAVEYMKNWATMQSQCTVTSN
jgi:hypothetical protein